MHRITPCPDDLSDLVRRSALQGLAFLALVPLVFWWRVAAAVVRFSSGFTG